MNPAVIRVQNLSKRYQIKAHRKASRMLRETLAGRLRSFFAWGGNGRYRKENKETIWALREVSFDVEEGEVVGIVGRNGAGKSTLLKILSRIVDPTEGSAEIRGRVASLLEVGTGFHSELSGRENIYLNGTILGMKRREIKRKFDAIVSFAEISKFIDTPVKFYSSGMHVRLAFAVAAHLDARILFVDEVLAVGDANFQRKCLGKIGEVSKYGKTVLLVSHNLTAVQRLCSKTVVLERGRLRAFEPTSESLRIYHRLLQEDRMDYEEDSTRFTKMSGAVKFVSVQAQDEQGVGRWNFRVGETAAIKITYRATERVPNLCLYFGLYSSAHQELLTTIKSTISKEPLAPETEGTVTLQLPHLCLRPGEYHPYIWVGNLSGMIFDRVDSLFHNHIPPLTISSDEPDPQLTSGYFSLPWRIIRNSEHV